MAYFISPTGNDLNPGTVTFPFMTLMRAVEETRASHDKVIILGGGNYDNIYAVLDERDNGLLISGEKKEAVLRGGVRAGIWQKEGSDLYSLRLPPQAPINGRILEINGELKARTRFPKSGFARHMSKFNIPWLSTSGGVFAEMPEETQRSQLIYNPDEIPADFDWNDTEITVMHRWDESFVCAGKHDPDRHIIEFQTPCGNPPGSFEVYDFAVWNSAWGIEPGHWRIDKNARVIYYRALPGEDMRTVCTYIPLYDSIIRINGAVTDLTIKNITFMTTASPMVGNGFIRDRIPNTYGAVGVTGALDSEGNLTRGTFSGLRFNNVGGWGIRLNGENNDVCIDRCLVQDSGAGGIMIKKGKDCTVTGNRIDNTGLVHYSAIGIYANGCDIIENNISNTTYSGIVSGGGSDGKLIVRNRVNTSMTILDDGAGIYVTFSNKGVMGNNIVENTPPPVLPNYQRHALYIDEQANGWVVEGNITVNCPSALLSHMNYKGGNTIRNNIFVNHDGDLILSLIRCNEHRIEDNIFHASGAVTFTGKKGSISAFKGNSIFSARGLINRIYINDDYTRSQPIPLDDLSHTPLE